MTLQPKKILRFYFRIDKEECYNAREASNIFRSIFEDVTKKMMNKLIKTNMNITFEDVKKIYFAKEKEEKEFLDVLIILTGFEDSVDYVDVKVTYLNNDRKYFMELLEYK